MVDNIAPLAGGMNNMARIRMQLEIEIDVRDARDIVGIIDEAARELRYLSKTSGGRSILVDKVHYAMRDAEIDDADADLEDAS